MVNKKLSKQEKEQKELEAANNRQMDYGAYVVRIEARIKNGEDITIKPYEEWVRKIKRTVDGIETEGIASGDSGETGKERFKRLSESRMVKVLDSLDLIKNLSASQYESTEKQQTQIVNALRLKVLDIENSFKVSEKKEVKFTLEE